MQRQGADIFAVGGENVLGGTLRIRPGLSVYFNDPSGVLKYELYALANYSRPLARQLFFQAETKLQLVENVSDVTQPSNSTLPHVRTDIAQYKRASDFKLTRLSSTASTIRRSASTARLSAGIYEEMFGGVGGQALYRATEAGRPTSRWTGCDSATSRAGSGSRTTRPSPRSPRSTTAWRTA